METLLKLRFTPNKQDYIRASRALARKTPAFIVLAAVIVLIMIGSAVILIVPSIGNATWTNVAVVSLLVGAFYLVYYFLVIPMQLSRSYKSNAYLQTERVFFFNDDHVTMHVGEKTSELHWENFEKVIDGKELYLIIYKAEERVYPFITKRAFKDEASEISFRQIFKEKSISLK
jgi:hypothetical protein